MPVSNATPPLQGLATTPPVVSQPPAAMPEVQFDPQQLADIHLPETIGFWPVAPGWWLLLAVLLLAVLMILLRKKIWKNNRASSHRQWLKLLRKQAATELQTIEQYYSEQGHEHETVRRLSVFLRRYALSLYPRKQVASLTDEQWLKLLDQLSGSELYSKKFAQLLTEAPYQPDHQAIDSQLISQLFVAAKQLLEAAPPEVEHV